WGEREGSDVWTGGKGEDALAGACQDLEAGRVEPADEALAAAAKPVTAREPGDLLRLLLSHLRDKSTERVAARRAAAAGELAAELARLERYFESILKEQSSEEAIGTVSALAARRRTEEIRRSEVRATVHAVQLVEASAVIE